MTPKEILKKYYGYDNFRDQQEAIINHVLAKKDAVVVMPTVAENRFVFKCLR